MGQPVGNSLARLQVAPPTGLQPIIKEGSTELGASAGMDGASSLWNKADAYYFRSMARLQRLWRVCCQYGSRLGSAASQSKLISIPDNPAEVCLTSDRLLSGSTQQH